MGGIIMKDEEAISLLKEIDAFYSGFTGRDIEQAKFKLRLWKEKMLEWDYAETKKKLDAYILENEFPPRIADIKPHTQVKYSIKDQLDEIYGDLDD